MDESLMLKKDFGLLVTSRGGGIAIVMTNGLISEFLT